MNAQQPAVTAIILAGGKGTRMGSDLPKVMHELRGRTLIRHAIDNVRKAGLGDVIAVVGHRRDLVMEHLDGLARLAVQEEQLGTGHAVLAALPLLEDSNGPCSSATVTCLSSTLRRSGRPSMACRGRTPPRPS